MVKWDGVLLEVDGLGCRSIAVLYGEHGCSQRCKKKRTFLARAAEESLVILEYYVSFEMALRQERSVCMSMVGRGTAPVDHDVLGCESFAVQQTLPTFCS